MSGPIVIMGVAGCGKSSLLECVAGLMRASAGEIRLDGQPVTIDYIKDLAARVKALTRSESPIQYIPYDEAYEAGFEDMPRRVPDIGKIRALICYEPQVGLDDIIRSVIEHMRTH